MDEQLTETKGTGRVLRHKIVNLLYLIFIVLAFLHIPSNFVDLFSEINRSLESSTQSYFNEKSYDLYHYNLQIFDYLVQKSPEEGKILKQNFNIITENSSELIENIEKYKKDLIQEARGINEYGYPEHAKNYNHTEDILLETNLADTLHSRLLQHREKIIDLASENIISEIDILLPLSDKIILANGKEVKWPDYYFKKNPVAGAITILSMFQLGLKKSDQIVLESYIIRLNQDEEEVNMGISTQKTEKLQAVLTFGNTQKTLQINSRNQIKFIPELTGRYRLSVFNSNKTVDVDFDVIQSLPAIIAGRNPVLYTDIYNPLESNHKEIPFKNLSITTTNGEILKINNVFHFRAEDTGITEISVFGNRNNNKILLATQVFEIKKLPEIYASLTGETDTDVGVSVFKSQKALSINSKTIPDVSFTVKSFVIKRISNSKLTNVNNKGDKFSAQASKLINEAVAGDVYVFDEIVAMNVFGNEIPVPSVLYYIN